MRPAVRPGAGTGRERERELERERGGNGNEMAMGTGTVGGCEGLCVWGAGCVRLCVCVGRRCVRRSERGAGAPGTDSARGLGRSF